MSNNNKFIVVRLNSITSPVIPHEERELKKIGAKMICIEGTSPDEIIKTAKDSDALSVVSSKIRAEVIN